MNILRNMQVSLERSNSIPYSIPWLFLKRCQMVSKGRIILNTKVWRTFLPGLFLRQAILPPTHKKIPTFICTDFHRKTFFKAEWKAYIYIHIQLFILLKNIVGTLFIIGQWGNPGKLLSNQQEGQDIPDIVISDIQTRYSRYCPFLYDNCLLK